MPQGKMECTKGMKDTPQFPSRYLLSVEAKVEVRAIAQVPVCFFSTDAKIVDLSDIMLEYLVNFHYFCSSI